MLLNSLGTGSVCVFGTETGWHANGNVAAKPTAKTSVMTPRQKTFRRIVTGHDVNGKAVIISDGPPTHTKLVGGPGGPTFFEVWHTLETPALIHAQPDEPAENGLVLPPPKRGTRIRVIEFPPAPHPLMHRTRTVDYGIVLEGEITLVLDDVETTIQAGDIVIQNGTNHAWANRSGKVCRMAFMLIDGEFTNEIAQPK